MIRPRAASSSLWLRRRRCSCHSLTGWSQHDNHPDCLGWLNFKKKTISRSKSVTLSKMEFGWKDVNFIIGRTRVLCDALWWADGYGCMRLLLKRVVPFEQASLLLGALNYMRTLILKIRQGWQQLGATTFNRTTLCLIVYWLPQLNVVIISVALMIFVAPIIAASPGTTEFATNSKTETFFCWFYSKNEFCFKWLDFKFAAASQSIKHPSCVSDRKRSRVGVQKTSKFFLTIINRQGTAGTQ